MARMCRAVRARRHRRIDTSQRRTERPRRMWDEKDAAVTQFIKENPQSYVSMVRFLFLLLDKEYEEEKAK